MKGNKICFNKKYSLLFLVALLLIGLFIKLDHEFLSNKKIYQSKASTVAPKITKNSGMYISGGTNVTSLEKWPFVVRIRKISEGSTGWGYCDGTLISNKWVLTAGHCITGEKSENYRKYNVSEIEILAGQINLESMSDDNKYQVDQIIRHDGYIELDEDNCKSLNQCNRKGTSLNDIALIKLSGEGISDTNIKTVSLNNKAVQEAEEITATGLKYKTGNKSADKQSKQGAMKKQPGVLVGWGKTADDTSSPDLKQGIAPILSFNRVISVPWFTTGKISSNEVAMGYPRGGVSACRGDSGGPALSWDAENMRWVQIGIISWKTVLGPCGSANMPAVNLRVLPYIQWITDHAGVTANSGTFSGQNLDSNELAEFNRRIYTSNELSWLLETKSL